MNDAWSTFIYEQYIIVQSTLPKAPRVIASQPSLPVPRSTPDDVASFLPLPPVVQFERILRIHGYSDFSRVRPAIVAAAEAAARVAPQLCAPRVAYRFVPVRRLDGDMLHLAGDVCMQCAAFAKVLAGCTDVVAFVLTLGPRLDARVVELAEAGDLLDALLLETAAWLCIEDATRQFRGLLRDAAARRGHRITSRMGPGYSYRIDDATCVWRLEEQVSLFALFGAADIPVTLMESCAMQPKMSRSGMIGIAPLPARARGLPPATVEARTRDAATPATRTSAHSTRGATE